MRPFDHAWQLLKSYTSGEPNRGQIDPKLHIMQSSKNSGMGFARRMPRPKTLENRQFNVGDTYNELEAANFSTGDEMTRRIKHAKALESKTGRPNEFANFRATEDYPALTDDDMAPNLRFPFRSKLEGNPSQFAEEGNFPIGSEIE
tara:strand:+ start:537 stop:974 length:438 start_codon:yes stop_codon:yes gene_type:complete